MSPASTSDTWARIKATFRWSFETTASLYRTHGRSLRLMQVGFYGIVVGSALLARRFPSLRAASIARVNAQLEGYEAGRQIVKVYESGQTLQASLITFFGNMTVGAFMTITAPSFLLPFSGVALTAYRAMEWGFLFATDTAIWHYITLAVEGQAYVLAAWASWIQSMILFKSLQTPSKLEEDSVAKDSRSKVTTTTDTVPAWWKRADWRSGWEITKAVYGPVTAILFASAFWEAFEVIHLGTARSVKPH